MQSADENRAFFTSSSFFFDWPSGVTGQSEVFQSRDAARCRVDGLEMLTSFSTFVLFEFLHCTAVWLEPLAIVEKQFEQTFTWLGTGFDVGWPCLRFFFAIIEEHSISLLYKFCTNRCLLTVIQLFFPDHKNLKLEFQSFFFFKVYIFTFFRQGNAATCANSTWKIWMHWFVTINQKLICCLYF